MTTDGTAKDDVKVPEGDLGKQIREDFEAGKDLIVTIVSAMNEEAVSNLMHRYSILTGSRLLLLKNLLPSRPFVLLVLVSVFTVVYSN